MFRIKSLYFLPPAFVKRLVCDSHILFLVPVSRSVLEKNPRHSIPSRKVRFFLENSDKFVGYNVVLVA